MARTKMDSSHIRSNFSSFLNTDTIDDKEIAYQNYLAKCTSLKLQQYVAFEDLKIDLKQILREICTKLEQQLDKEEL